jgi:membrane-bound lytic murein transglycosylase B
MKTWRATMAMALGMLGLAALVAAAEPEKKGNKPVVSCAQIVETYKVNQSVDETADALEVDQSRVAACLKAAGIKMPAENDR